MEFKAGDKVKIEGILEENDDSIYSFKIKVNEILLTFTKTGKYTINSSPILELVERPKQKVKKYKVLFQYNDSRLAENTFDISNQFYKNREEYELRTVGKFIHLILESEQEFEE